MVNIGRNRRLGRSCAVLAALLLALALTPAAHAYSVLTDAQKETKALDIMTAFVPRAEQFWCANGSRTGFCTSSYEHADTTGYFYAYDEQGVAQMRGEGEIALVYATLLTELPSQNSFGGVTRTTMLDHAEQAIRHVMYTNTWRYSGGDPLEWGGASEWQGSLLGYNAAWAAQLLWGGLSSSTRSIVNTIVPHEANVQAYDKDPKTINPADPGDTHAEDNAWNTGILAAAAAMYPRDSHRADWIQAAKEFAVNAFTKPSDSTNSELIDGVAMSTWKTTTNINEDLTLYNHDFFHPTYLQGLYQNLSDSADFLVAGVPAIAVPEAMTYRLADVWSDVLGPLTTDDGDILHPVGTDWTRHDYQHLTTLSVLATRQQDAVASVMESRGLELLAARQAATGTGSLFGNPKVGYEADVARNVAGVYWNHRLFSASPAPSEATFDSARAALQGVVQLPDAKTIVNAQPAATTSVSWDDSGKAEPSVVVVPSSSASLADPVLIAALPKSGFHLTPGTVGSYTCDCRSGFFSTAATSTDGTSTRNMSVTSFADGTTLMLDRASGGSGTHAFNWGFETIPGMTGTRTVYAEDGTGIGAHTGNWLNVADRFGLIVQGGGGLIAYETRSDPRDPNVAQNNNVEIEGSNGIGSGYRVATVLPNATHTQTDALEPETRKLTASSGWAGMTARALDGSERIAVARWGGSSSASFTVTTGRGAPIFDVPTTVDGSSGTVSYSLSTNASTGAGARYYLTTTARAPVTATAMSDGRVKIVNSGAGATTASVSWVDATGTVRSASRSVAAGQTMYALGNGSTVQIVLPSASSTEAPGTTYPPALAFDADTTGSANFWVSAPVNLSTTPQTLALDYGTSITIGRLAMIPRRGFGPKSYVVETSTDGSSWTQRGSSVVNATDGATVSTTFTPVSARYVRIRVSDTYGSSSPNQQPQVRELQVSAR